MSNEAAVGLIRALIENVDGPDVDRTGWESFAMILQFPGGKFNEAHGYLYSPDGTVSAVAADPWKVEAAVKEYTDGYYRPGDALPVKILVRFGRAKGKYDVAFEDADETRWKMTPRNFRTIHDELRPAFD
ncbi:hypothetical protein ACFYZN_22755 [Streptomyces sp. NPDC001777]|uniref:hypothetical protein n=1 Tax=Streptomyces sp. NPDC001777 TaxID=3364608 RepID=UPI0036B2D236